MGDPSQEGAASPLGDRRPLRASLAGGAGTVFIGAGSRGRWAQATAGDTSCNQSMSISFTRAGRSSGTQCPQPAKTWLLTSPGMVEENESITFWIHPADASRAPPTNKDGWVIAAPSYAARSSQSRSTLR